MNRTAALDRDRSAPSSPASTANRMTATESLFPEGINDFCNKIINKLTRRPTLSLDSRAYSYRSWSVRYSPNT
jgi:hypothetical protein